MTTSSEREDELVRFAWAKGVPAPVDADGEVVPLNAWKLYTNDGEAVGVGCFIYDRYSWSVGNLRGDKLYSLDTLHRAKQDSWKKLEEDIQKVAGSDVCRYFDKTGKPCGDCPACRTQDSCPSAALQDVMRRAKALAERDVKASTPQSSPHEAKEADRVW